MLAGVLLHVIAASRRINHSAYCLSWLNRARSEMKYPSIFFPGRLRNRYFPSVIQHQFSGIVHLSAAGGIKRGLIQHHGDSSLPLGGLKHTGIEAVEKGVVIVEALSHENCQNSKYQSRSRNLWFVI